MTRIIASTLVVISMLAAVTNATLAVFTDAEELEGNVLAADEIMLTLGGSEAFEDPIFMENALPGVYSPTAKVTVNNADDTSSFALYYQINFVDGEACDKVFLEVERSSGVYQGYLADYSNELPLGFVLDPEDSVEIDRRAKLHESAGNSEMNESCTWTENFIAKSVVP